ncbi:MAG TPA: XRE family transcriptional regulator [Kofleriaceae bacterium]|nr:XRE family transcriptional regulator [Kofleriaceae bacterium]
MSGDFGLVAAAMGANLRRLRRRRGLSVERLAALAGVSRSTISDIERATKTPTVNVISRLATALGIDFAALVDGRTSGAVVVTLGERVVKASRDRRVTVACLFPAARPRFTRLYQLDLGPEAWYAAGPRAAGTSCHVVVERGAAVIDVGGQRHAVAARDAIVFAADAPHGYANPGLGDAALYVAVSGGAADEDGAGDWYDLDAPDATGRSAG